jgi:predicted dehydrogenase
MKKNLYTFAIIGAGQIACGYDGPNDQHILTHAHAINTNPNARLLGFYDIDAVTGIKASEKWGGKSFSSIPEMLAEKPNVVIICAPDSKHMEVLESLLDDPPKIVICEKPLTLRYESSLRILDDFIGKGVCLGVNYQRRFDPVVTELKRKFEVCELGKFLCGTAYYSKGLMHNGSHAIDLLRFIFGDVKSFSSIKKIFDFTPEDPSIYGIVRFECGDVTIIPGDERAFSIFEIDLLFEKARYKFSHSGMDLEIQKPVADDVYPGYFELFTESKIKTGFTNALSLLVDECIDYLSTGAPLRIEARNILDTQLLCESMVKSETLNLNSRE